MSLNVCRGCLTESYSLKNIFSLKIEIDYVHNLNFSDCFQVCTDISIEKSDNLPQTICDQCIESLVAAYKYRTQCKKSDLKLRSKTVNNVVSVIAEEAREAVVENHNVIDSTCEVLNPPVEEHFDDENDMIVEKLEEDFYEEFDENYEVPVPDGALEINSHNSVEHEENNEPTDTNNKYDCKICGSSMESRSKFLYHMRLHRQTYPCQICCKYSYEIRTKNKNLTKKSFSSEKIHPGRTTQRTQQNRKSFKQENQMSSL